jgi:hypothetical protein
MAVEKEKLWISNELRPGLGRSLYGTQQYPRLEKIELTEEKMKIKSPFFFCIRTQKLMIQYLARKNEITGEWRRETNALLLICSLRHGHTCPDLKFFILGGRNRSDKAAGCPTRNFTLTLLSWFGE